jgi:hypothetical protein
MDSHLIRSCSAGLQLICALHLKESFQSIVLMMDEGTHAPFRKAGSQRPVLEQPCCRHAGDARHPIAIVATHNNYCVGDRVKLAVVHRTVLQVGKTSTSASIHETIVNDSENPRVYIQLDMFA